MNSTMKYKNLLAAIHYDDDDKIFWGEVIGINDSISFHGHSVNELEDRFHLFVDEYLEECHSKGIEPEKTYTGNFNVRIDPCEHKIASMCAVLENISLNQYVGKAVAAMNRELGY